VGQGNDDQEDADNEDGVKGHGHKEDWDKGDGPK